MSRPSALLCPLALLLCLACLSGCMVPATFNPVEGPLAAQRPTPVYTTEVNNPIYGHLAIVLANGETFKGVWHFINRPGAALASDTSAPESAQDLEHDWDFVYGPGYFRAHVLGALSYARAYLTGSAGSTAVVEVYNEHDECGEAQGVARDSHGNVYKVTVYSTCIVPQAVASGPLTSPTSAPAQQSMGPRMVIPVTGGPPVMAIPLGSGTYQPITGGAPIVGTPIN